jgi:hypothetical protein
MMARRSRFTRIAVVLGLLACVCATTPAQSPQGPSQASGRPGREQLEQPVYRVAEQAPAPGTRVAAKSNAVAGAQGAPAGGQPQQPLVPAIQIAHESLSHIRNNVKDYSATMFKHEKVDGKLQEMETMYIQVRHEPFSVYMYFLAPDRLKGQECLYVEGKNDGKMIARGTGIKKIVGAVPLDPKGAMAMAGNRYPITEIGMNTLTKRLIEVGEQDKKFGECDVKFYRGAKIGDRSSTCIEVIHPVKRANFKFNKALVFVDDELKMPVRYEAFEWPDKPGGQPQLLEEYTYTHIKVNNGYTDYDFDENNPKYHFH